jgi:diadenosine tetraphosphatase ApaH/serine/threonine PP2A family protein phosphatase
LLVLECRHIQGRMAIMRIALLSDIHSNLVALEAVLEALPEFDQLWCLGDTIGYGPRPNECLQRIRDLGTYVLSGNHDLASLQPALLVDFNPLARRANEWNGEQLLPELRAYLEERPSKQQAGLDATLAHASPRDPVWEYVDTIPIALANFAHFPSQLCLVGHTHVPMSFALHTDGRAQYGHAQHEEVVHLRPGSRYIINPGSVGQPRDGNPEAAYAMWDTEAATIRFRRIGYDIGATQRQMLEARLPVPLAERLAFGQ